MACDGVWDYLDADNLDQYSKHLIGLKDDKIVAYMRIVDPHQLYNHISFGRILVVKEFRGIGVGIDLMKQAIDMISVPGDSIVMSAQSYLIDFYRKFGFCTIGEEYLEDNIPHIKMIRNG